MSLEQSRLRALVARGDVQGITEWVDEVIQSALAEAPPSQRTNPIRSNLHAELAAIAEALGLTYEEGMSRASGVVMAAEIRQRELRAISLLGGLLCVAESLGMVDASDVVPGSSMRPDPVVMAKAIAALREQAELLKQVRAIFRITELMQDELPTYMREIRDRLQITDTHKHDLATIAAALGMWKPGSNASEVPAADKIAGVITQLLEETPPPVGRAKIVDYVMPSKEERTAFDVLRVSWPTRAMNPHEAASREQAGYVAAMFFDRLMNSPSAPEREPVRRTWASQDLEDIAIALGLWKLEQGPDAMPTGQAMISRIRQLQRLVLDQSTRSVVTGRSSNAPAAEYFPPNEGIRVKGALKFICKELATAEQLDQHTRTVFAEAHRHLIGDAPIPGGT